MHMQHNTGVAARAVDVTKVYGSGDTEVRALDGVSVDIAAGRMTAIMGPSGSGKSTLMHCLAGLDQVTAGAVYVGDTELGSLTDRQLTQLRRERIGFVFQAFNLLPRSTALQNVELPLIYGRVGREERRERASAALAAVGLADREGHMPSQLSGGQQQRVAVARAIVTEPAVLLADEPTGNLDSHSEAEVLAILERVHGEGATIVMVTHAREVAEHGTRIVHMMDGSIDADEAL
jgi:putative ABC transport system ATP-binding protein